MTDHFPRTVLGRRSAFMSDLCLVESEKSVTQSRENIPDSGDDTLFLELSDAIPVVTKLQEDLFGVLAKLGA